MHANEIYGRIKSYSKTLEPFSVVKSSALYEAGCTLVTATVLLSTAVIGT
jgi:hypothetical protein